MAERNKLASIPGQPLPERKGNFLSDLWDEASGAFARYGRRSGAQRDASLAMLGRAIDPQTGLFEGTALGGLGLLGLATHPFAVLPTGEEMRERAANAGNTDRLTQSVGGALTDFVSMLDPGMAVKGGLMAAAPIVGKLGRGIGDLAGDATDAELAALRARLQAEAAQTGGAPSAVSREQALESMVDQPQRRQLTTQSYKETLPDGTTRWVPGTLRSNPTTAPRFEPSMSIADIRRYIEQFGEPPPPRAKDELITGKRKDVYPDGTATPVPGLLRTKRPDPLAAKMLNKADDVAELKRWSKPTIRGEEIDAYHGTGAAFDEFTIPDNRGTKGAGSGESPIGIWTTDSPQAADAFADFSARGQGANVRPVTVRFKNPLEVNDYSQIQDLVDKFTEFSRPNYVVGGRQLRMTTDKIDYEGLRKHLADQGYDGIALRQTMTDAPDVELPDGSVTRNPIGQFISLDPQSVRPRFGRK